MGTAATLVPYVIATLAAGASAYNTKRTADKQDAVAAEGIRQQAARQREADARASQEIDSLEQSSPEDEQAHALDQYLSRLRANRGNAAGDDGRTEGASDEYRRDSATAKADIANYGEKLADVMSRIRAPMEQRRSEAYGRMRTASDLEGVARNAEGDNWLNQLRQSRVRRNQWLDAAAAAGLAYAGAAAGGAGAGAGGGAPSGGISAGTNATGRLPTVFPVA